MLTIYLCCLFIFTNIKAKEECIYVYSGNNPIEVKAKEELCKYLKVIYPQIDFLQTALTDKSPLVVIGSYDTIKRTFDLNSIQKPKGFSVSSIEGSNVQKFIIGSDARATLDGVYSLLEKLGYGFYLTHDTNPRQKAVLDFSEWDISDFPLMKERIVFNWHNFLSGCTSWNYADWEEWIDQSSKMKFNSIMVHAYANNPMYQYEVNGIKKQIGYMNTSNSGRDWGGEHVNDVRLLPGGFVFSSAVFGSEAATVPDSQRGKAAVSLMRKVFDHAKECGMNVIFSLDTDVLQANPQEIILSLPQEARFKSGSAWLPNPESPEGYNYIKQQISCLMNLYPQIDKIAIWIRDGGWSLWSSMKSNELPQAWKKEYNEFLKYEGRVVDDVRASGSFVVAKMVKAYQLALKELNYDDKELMLGTWDWNLFRTANYFLPKEVTFIPLDFNRTLDYPSTQYILNQIGNRRKLIPVVWAQHDDHRYIGRSYCPFNNFYGLLRTEKAAGFGIIHWTTAPHDLFFKNLTNQTWNLSKNERLEKTIEDYVQNEWKTSSYPLREYLYKWSTEAPMFGEETTDFFFGRRQYALIKDEFGSYKDIIQKANERLKLLEKVKKEDIKCNPRLLEYLKGMEKFYIATFDNYKYFEQASVLLEQNKRKEACEILHNVYPEKMIELYAQTIQKGFNTIGEKGIVYSLATRFYPLFIDLQQQLGMIPVKLKLGKTKHDILAQEPGRYTWFFDHKKNFYKVLGKHEIGEHIKEEEHSVTFDSPISIRVTSFYDKPLAEGNYNVSIHLLTNQDTELPVEILYTSGLKTSPINYKVISDNGDTKIDFIIPVDTRKEESIIKIVPQKKIKATQINILKI